MASEIRIELDHAGIAQLLKSDPGITQACRKAAFDIANRAGSGWRVSRAWEAGFGGGRVAFGVFAKNYEALVDEAENKALTKAVHG